MVISTKKLKSLYPDTFSVPYYEDVECVALQDYTELINNKLYNIFTYFDKNEKENYPLTHFAQELIIRFSLSLEHYIVTRILEIIKYHNDNNLPIPEGDYNKFSYPTSTEIDVLPKDGSYKYLVGILGFPERNKGRSYRKIATIVCAFECYYSKFIIHEDGPIPSIVFNTKLESIMFPIPESFTSISFDDVFGEDIMSDLSLDDDKENCVQYGRFTVTTGRRLGPTPYNEADFESFSGLSLSSSPPEMSLGTILQPLDISSHTIAKAIPSHKPEGCKIVCPIPTRLKRTSTHNILGTLTSADISSLNGEVDNILSDRRAIGFYDEYELDESWDRTLNALLGEDDDTPLYPLGVATTLLNTVSV